ncbi:MAG: folate-binding protein, partial [Beijerinckiaceae bacterium]
MPHAFLQDRGVIRISGDESRAWLNNLVTCDVASLTPGEGRWGALLTPQGKIVADFFITEAPQEDGGGFLIDAPRPLISDLMKRLSMYRLRAKLGIDDLSDGAGVG